MKKPFRNKKIFKREAGSCAICKDSEYTVLDTHRIVEGKNGGKYTFTNCVCLCTKCHRKEQAGLIEVLGWVNSTSGRLLHYIDEDGNEQFSI